MGAEPYGCLAVGEGHPGKGNSQCQGAEAAGDLTCSRISKKPAWLRWGRLEGMKEELRPEE